MKFCRSKARLVAVFLVFVGLLLSCVDGLKVCAAAAPERELPVVYATDDNYVGPTLVSIYSASMNAKPGTKLNISVLVPGNISESKKSRFKVLDAKLDNCSIKLIDMGNAFKDLPETRWGEAAFYRLKLASVLKDYDKCIYLDGDTVVLEDLCDLYDNDLKDNYVGGVPDGFRLFRSYGSKIGIDNMDNYICSGVLLWNLKKIREDGKEKDFETFLKKNVGKNDDMLFPDQDAINVVCYSKIMQLPFRYGAIVGLMSCEKYERDPCVRRLLTKSDWEEAKDSMVVIHFVGKKPWSYSKIKYGNLWISYLYDLLSLLGVAKFENL